MHIYIYSKYKELIIFCYTRCIEFCSMRIFSEDNVSSFLKTEIKLLLLLKKTSTFKFNWNLPFCFVYISWESYFINSILVFLPHVYCIVFKILNIENNGCLISFAKYYVGIIRLKTHIDSLDEHELIIITFYHFPTHRLWKPEI